MKGSIVLCIVFLLSTVFAQSRFSAKVSVQQPGMNGAVTGNIFYDSTSNLMRIEYTKLNIFEVYNFTDGVRYIKCGSTCNAESVKYAMPKFYKTSSDTADSSITCSGGSGFRRSGSGKDVTRIAFVGNNVCKAILGDGTTYEFSNVDTTPNFAGKWDTSGCPQKTCKQKLDIMLVMDESGSISSGEWNTMKTFANRFTQAFSVSESEAKIGLVAYSSGAVLRFAYQNSEQSVRNTMNNLKRYYGGGNTYTNTALNVAANAQSRYGRNGVKSITVVITDGFCSCNDNSLVSSSAPLKQSGYVFAVGVDGADTKELGLIASGSGGTANINGKSVKTVFFANQWDQLNTLLKDLIDATCTEFPGNPCGSGCNGFCGCNKQCVCPDDCSTVSDFCNNGVCSSGAAGNGCRKQAKPDPCDDNNACTNEVCDASAGQCQRSNVVCPDKKCHTKTCDKAKGCVYTPIDCSDTNPCTAEFCDTTLGANGECSYPPKDCDRCRFEGKNVTTCSVGQSKCENWDCVQRGQTATCEKISDVNCDDLNACTKDSCNEATGTCINEPIVCNDSRPCTIDSCDVNKGCVYEPVNETEFCNDFSVCTIDRCSDNVTNGCYHVDIVCNQTVGPCTVGVCNSVLGCQYPSKNCAEEPGFKEKLGDCYAALCNDGAGLVTNVTTDKLGCYLDLQPDAVIDDCGVCRGDGTSCGFPLTVAEAAGIGAGVIGAIAAGAAVFAIASGIGAKKGYDAYMRNKNNMSGAQSNPMYNDGGRTGQNPMYEMK